VITEQAAGPSSTSLTLIGFLAGVAVLVRTPAEGGLSIPSRKAARHSASFQRLARLFVRKLCRAGSSQSVPLPVLGYPSTVTGMAIRKAMRVKDRHTSTGHPGGVRRAAPGQRPFR